MPSSCCDYSYLLPLFFDSERLLLPLLGLGGIKTIRRVCSIYNSVSLGAVKILILRLHSRSPESESECALGSTVQHIPQEVLRSKEKFCSRKTIEWKEK